MDLNHRPSGYEPNELPDCSTPQLSNYITLYNVYCLVYEKFLNIYVKRIISKKILKNKQITNSILFNLFITGTT